MRTPIWKTASTARPYIGGHRGASAVAPENTAAAYEAAIAAGADFIETDLRLTRDGVAVAFHDNSLQRLCGDARAVEQLDFEELKVLHPAIVRMADAIDLIGDRASILLDTKITDLTDLERAAGMLGSRLVSGRAAFGVRSLAALGVIKTALPNCPTLGLFNDIGEYPQLAERGGDWARLWQSDVSVAAINGLREQGLKVIIMAGLPETVGQIEADALQTLLDMQPDAIMLNDPQLAVGLQKAAAAQA